MQLKRKLRVREGFCELPLISIFKIENSEWNWCFECSIEANWRGPRQTIWEQGRIKEYSSLSKKIPG